MQPLYFMPIIVLFIILYITSRNQKAVVARKIIKKRKMEDKIKMFELAKKFIDKKCYIVSFDRNLQVIGIIKEVSNSAILIEKDGMFEAINLDYIIRIREYPKKKK